MRRVPMRRVPKHRGTGREEQSAEEPSAELSAEEPSAEEARASGDEPSSHTRVEWASGVLYGVRQREIARDRRSQSVTQESMHLGG